MPDRGVTRELTPSVSVVIPVYRSADILPSLVSRLGETLSSCATAFEIILVNDASPDDSWNVIRELAAQHAWITGIDLMRNFGQHNAVLCGIRAVRHEIIVTMDDDLQHPPEEIPRLLDALVQGYDVVYGTPQCEQHGFWRDIASQVTKIALQGAMGMTTARQVSAFRAFRTCAREGFARYQGPYVSIDVLLTWATTKFTSVPTRHAPRLIGRSNYTFRSLVRHTLNMITGFSIWPLRVASMIGFGFTLFGLGVLVYVIAAYFALGRSVPGFPFLASVVAVFSGAQLFALGIMGEYLARMHFRMMDRPSYTIRASTPRR